METSVPPAVVFDHEGSPHAVVVRALTRRGIWQGAEMDEFDGYEATLIPFVRRARS